MSTCTCQQLLVAGHQVQKNQWLDDIYIYHIPNTRSCPRRVLCSINKFKYPLCMIWKGLCYTQFCILSRQKARSNQQVSKITEVYSCNAQNILTRYKILSHQVKHIITGQAIVLQHQIYHIPDPDACSTVPTKRQAKNSQLYCFHGKQAKKSQLT